MTRSSMGAIPAAAMTLLAATVWAANGPAGGDPDGAPSRARRTFEPYELLAERNVFLSTRREPRPPRPPVAREEPKRLPPPDPRKDWIVRGTLGVDGGFAALVEHLGTGQTRTVQSGEELCGETVAAVTFDGIRLHGDANDVREVLVGRTLLGEMGRGSSDGSGDRAFSTSRPGSGRPASRGADAEDEPAGPGSREDDEISPVLLRLLQQRREEQGGADGDAPDDDE